ncbi:bacteriochlorophyll/chlorophyll a synthase [Niveispirillum lacus]|uniref:Bacteriochlorophyll/chlorophyll a synthase n=1 Tax=Niveispirillum lacus TaxID=1981099 RepID=A0A255YZE3_9PROT|nr:chlorophyll synthase ChlG [Niveispirillum lacus]OYQ34592.1 bacteriochlorophyll/chlorophyll a synthase [Niveispirillum lacus]
MDITRTDTLRRDWPGPAAVLALLKPITWFPPMWAYACGVISSGQPLSPSLIAAALGMLLAGPLLCGTSQAVNDWFDRHVDAINEPDRVIPSGRMPGRWGLYIALLMSALSAAVAAVLGPLVFVAALAGLALAWGYSAPPFRFKQNGWIGNSAVGLSYETLPWITAATAMTGLVPETPLLLVALLYGVGAHGILTLNDFKSIRGDTEMNISTLPVLHGASVAARIACVVMAVPQLAVIGLLAYWSLPYHASGIALLLAIQVACMRRFLADPVGRAVWYSSVGVGLYVSGMMLAAFGLRQAFLTTPIG